MSNLPEESTPPMAGSHYVSTLIQSNQTLGIGTGQPDDRWAQWNLLPVNLGFTSNVALATKFQLNIGVTQIIDPITNTALTLEVPSRNTTKDALDDYILRVTFIPINGRTS